MCFLEWKGGGEFRILSSGGMFFFVFFCCYLGSVIGGVSNAEF